MNISPNYNLASLYNLPCTRSKFTQVELEKHLTYRLEKLSEELQEVNYKYFRGFRLHHRKMCNRTETNIDTMNSSSHLMQLKQLKKTLRGTKKLIACYNKSLITLICRTIRRQEDIFNIKVVIKIKIKLTFHVFVYIS